MTDLPPSEEQYLYGVHAIEEAVRAGTPIEKVWVQAGKRLPSAVNQLRKQGVPVQYVAPRWFRRFGSVAHQGIVALVAPFRYYRWDDLLDELVQQGDAIGLVLDGVTDVRNVGAIARSVYALGGTGLWLPQKEGALVSSAAIKASAGALLHLPVARYPSPQKLIEEAQLRGIRIVLAQRTPEAELLPCYSFEGPTLVVLGDEHRGIRPAFQRHIQESIAIPMEHLDSLNVAVAAGIIMYEWRRQRRCC